jgi:hypothetical protein
MPSQIPNPRGVEAEKITGTGSAPQAPVTLLNAANRSSANHALSTRVGGWIANLFSWYRY